MSHASSLARGVLRGTLYLGRIDLFSSSSRCKYAVTSFTFPAATRYISLVSTALPRTWLPPTTQISLWLEMIICTDLECVRGFISSGRLCYSHTIRCLQNLYSACANITGLPADHTQKSTLNTITIFQVALIITLVWKTVTSTAESSLFDLEAFLTLIYGVGGGFGTFIYALAQRSGRVKIGRAQDLCVNLITVSFGIYGIWFWFVGINTLVGCIPDLLRCVLANRCSLACPSQPLSSSSPGSRCTAGSKPSTKSLWYLPHALLWQLCL